MRIDYLHKNASSVFDANGAATVTIRPDVGQYWSPKFVRVSSSRLLPTNLIPYCAVYHGPVGAALPSTFIDDTFNGDGDTSGIISGTVVEYGEGLTANWSGGTPGDVVVFDVYGQSADVPPSLGLAIPDVLGPHFFGKPVKPQPWQAAQFTRFLFFTNPGQGNFVTVVPAPPAGQYTVLLAMEWHWTIVAATSDGTFRSAAGDFVYDVPDDLQPRYMDMKGTPANVIGTTQGVIYLQSGAGAANSTRCVGSIAYSYASQTVT